MEKSKFVQIIDDKLYCCTADNATAELDFFDPKDLQIIPIKVKDEKNLKS